MIEEKVITLIADLMGIEKNCMPLEQPLEQLHLDVFDLVDIVMELEDAFGIVIDDDTSFNNVKDIIEYIYAVSGIEPSAEHAQIA